MGDHGAGERAAFPSDGAGLLSAVIGDDIAVRPDTAALLLDPADPLPDIEPLAGARALEAVVELAQLTLEARGEARGNALFRLRPRLGVAVEPHLSPVASTTLCTWTVWRDRVSRAIARSGSKRRARSRLTTR